MKSATLKRVVSLVLVFAFVLTALPFALAADPKEPKENTKIAEDKSVDITAMRSSAKAIKDLFVFEAPSPFWYTEKTANGYGKRSKYETLSGTKFEYEAITFTLPDNYQLVLNGERYVHNGNGKTFTFTKEEVDAGYLDRIYLQAMPGAVSTSFTYTLKVTAKYTPLNDQNDPDIPKGKTLADVQKELKNFSLPNPATIIINLQEDGPIPTFNVTLNVDKKDASGKPINYYANIPASAFSAALAEQYPEANTAVIDHITGVDFLDPSEGVVVDSSGNAIGPNTKVDLSKESGYVVFLSPEPTGDVDKYDFTYHAVAKVNGGAVPYKGKVHLQAETPTDVEIPEFSRTISSSDKSVMISIDDIANAAKEARKPENLESVTIDKITFYFDNLDMSVNFANSSAIEPRVENQVYNSSTIQVTSKKPTSDVRLSFSAHGTDDVSYIGSIVIKGVTGELVNVTDIVKKIDASTGRSSMTVDEISSKCGGKKIVGITFTFSKDDVTLTLGSNTTVVSGTSYVVVNSSQILAVVPRGKRTSDVRVLYEATAEDGSVYKGYILYQHIESAQVDPVSGAYSIYVPGGSVLGSYESSSIASKIKYDNVTSFVVTNAVFTYTAESATGVKTTMTETIFNGSSWTNQAAFGYLASSGSTSGSAGVKSFGANEKLSYVPGTTSGTVTITYEAYGSNKIYTGTMTFTVYSVKNGVSVTLNLKSRAPYLFSNADNDKTIFADFIQASIKEAFGEKAVCKYVVFDTVQKSSTTYGTLYADSNKTALSVRSASQPTAGGYYFKDAIAGIATAPIANLYYVPTSTAGSYTQNYSVFVSFDGKDYELPGTLTIKTQPDSVINPDILYQVTTNTRVTFAARDFDTYLKNINKNYTFDYVRFTGMPASGNLFYGNTEITATTLGTYDFYETAGTISATINNVSYVPAGTNYYVTIPFTVYYKQSSTSTPASRTGTIVICVTSGLVQDINYTTKSGDSVYLKSEDFTSVCQAATGATLGHVYFTISSLPATDGRLSYSQQTASIGSSTPYYVLANAGKSIIDNVKFTSAKSSGTVTFQYTAYDAYGVFLYSGKINVKLYTETKTPAFSKCVLSAQKMICNGQAVSLQAYNIDGFNYLKLRDIAALLSGTGSKFSIQVTDNGVKREVYCTLGGNYTIVADDLQVGADQSKTCVASSWAFYVDGEYKSVYVYNIGGYNYFKLRDLGSALKFGVDYNSETNTAIITSSDYIA